MLAPQPDVMSSMTRFATGMGFPIVGKPTLSPTESCQHLVLYGCGSKPTVPFWGRSHFSLFLVGIGMFTGGKGF